MLALDTNPCVEILRVRHPSVVARYRATDPREVFLPSIVAAELLVGAEKSGRPSTRQDVETLLAAHDILPFGEQEMRIYATIRVHPEKAGNKISDNDLIVARPRSRQAQRSSRTMCASSRGYLA